MARKIVWTLKAQTERKEILQYWIQRNKSNSYSKKLNELFKKAVQLIRSYPNVGKPTDIENVRVKIIRDYLMFYEQVENQIYILTIWDSR